MRPRYEKKQPFDKLRANGKDKRRLCRPDQFGNIALEGAKMAGLGQKFERHRPLIGKLLFEIAIIFIGVTAAFALESARQGRAEASYRSSMIAALIPTLDDIELHNRNVIAGAARNIVAFDAALARGQQPKLPIYRETGGERPPVRAWDGIVATGVSQSLPPDVYFELMQFYNRLESAGERYIRYAQMTEQQIYPLGPDQRGIYDPGSGRLKPQYAAYVDRLREQVVIHEGLGRQAKRLKNKLQVLD